MSSNKEDVIYTKVIFNPDSISDDEGLDQATEIQLEDGMVHYIHDDPLGPEKSNDIHN
jgi:hypothetical protein